MSGIVIVPQLLLQEQKMQAGSGCTLPLHTAVCPFSFGWPVQPDSCWEGILRLKHSAAWGGGAGGCPNAQRGSWVPLRRTEDP